MKSRLYGEIIAAFAEAKIGFIGGPTEVVLQPGAELKSLVDGLSAARGDEPAGPGSAAPQPKASPT